MYVLWIFVLLLNLLTPTTQFFDFHSTKLERVLTLPANAVSITLQRDNGLLAVICDDNVVRVVDIETRSVVREFSGFRGRVLDLVRPSTILTDLTIDSCPSIGFLS